MADQADQDDLETAINSLETLGAAASLYYPEELINMGAESSTFKHWIKFRSFKLGVAQIKEKVQKIKEIVNGIRSIDDAKKSVGDIVNAVDGTNGVFDKQIGLYVPSQLVNKIGINYNIESLTLTEGAAAAARGVASGELGEIGIEEMVGIGAAAFAGGAFSGFIPKAAKVFFPEKMLKELGSFVSKKAGVAVNPRRTTIFDYPNLREFSFNFVFSPRSLGEDTMVKDIIKYFKQSALPVVFGLGSFQSYPNEFELTCMNGGKENTSLFKTKRCVIKDIDINYTPASMFNAFHTGSPTQMTLTLTMMETDILTAQDVENGVAY